MSETIENNFNASSGDFNTSLLMSLNKSIGAVEINLARLEERVSKALEMHGEVNLLKVEVQALHLHLKDFEERYDRERKEADERIKRVVSIAGLSATSLALLTTLLFWIVDHFKR